MSAEKYYRPSALAYYRDHIDGPELEDRRHTMPQVLSGLVALIGLSGLAAVAITCLPAWSDVKVRCDAGQPVALDLKPDSSRLVYRDGNASVGVSLEHAAAGWPFTAFRMERSADKLCQSGRGVTIRAIVQ